MTLRRTENPLHPDLQPDSTSDVLILELDARDGDIRETPDEYGTGESYVIGLLDEDAPAGLSSMPDGKVRGLLRKQVTSEELVAAVGAAAAGLLVFHRMRGLRPSQSRSATGFSWCEKEDIRNLKSDI